MRVTVILVLLVVTASASTQPRVVGDVSQADIRAITATIGAVTHDRIVFIRATPSVDRVGVQTESGPSAGCHYLLRRVGGAWRVAGKSCWTHTIRWPQDAEKRWPHVSRPSELSESDFKTIKLAVARKTHDEIRTIKVTRSTPLSVEVHTASPHIVTEGDYTLEKIGSEWRVTSGGEIIH